MAADAAVLNLSTLTERETVKIDSQLYPEGKLYELRNADELSVVEHQTIVSRHQQVVKIESKDPEGISSAEARRLTDALDEIVRVVLHKLEPEVLAELSDRQKAAIAGVWADLATAEGDEGNPEAPSTGGDSSRDSNASTEDPPTPGSTSRSDS